MLVNLDLIVGGRTSADMGMRTNSICVWLLVWTCCSVGGERKRDNGWFLET